jgi:WD40 repeat protein/tetratricopeptide (TPR) repeat protein
MPDDSVLLGQLAEEFSGRVRRGELPAVEEYAGRHPALAERIRALFPTLMLLEGMAGARVGPGATIADGGAGRDGALAAGQVFNHYRIEREIGRGGMGVVYEATHLPLDKRVALKVLPVLPGEGAGQLERFLREAKTAAGLHHTNIVPVFDIGQAGGTPYFAMQLIDGRGLDKVLHDWQNRPPADLFRLVARLGVQAADALACAHQRGVIHRDIKPSNLLLDGQGVVWVTDFGLARRTSDAALTQAGALVGTPRYMSPEQAEAAKRPVDHRTDVYSLGATLYELVARRPPFDGPTPVEVLLQVIEREPVPPRRLAPGLPRDLETVILKAMAKRPDDRYPTAQDLADDLRRFLAGEPVRARRVGPVGRLARWSRRNPAVAGLLLAVFLTTTGGMGVACWFAWQADQSARNARTSASQAEEARVGEAARAEESRQRLVRQYIANGVRLADEGHPLGALPWLVEALALETGGPEREQTHRIRIGTLLHQAPRLEHVWGEPAHLFLAELSPDGRRVVTAGGAEDGSAGLVNVWDAATGAAVLPPLRHEAPADRPRLGALVSRVAFSPDGRRLASVSGDAVAVWDLETGRRLASWRVAGDVSGLRFSPDGRRVLTAWDRSISRDVYANEARVWEAATGQPVTPLLEHGRGYSYYGGDSMFSPDGRHVATAAAGVKVWDATTGRLVFFLDPPVGVTSADYSPDGKRLLTGGQDGTVRLWDARTGQQAGEPLKHDGPVTGARFSPDGGRVLSIARGAVHLWEVATRAPVRTLRPPHGSVHKAALRSDGLVILAECDDDAVRLWDADGGPAAPVLPLPWPGQARLSRDGRHVLTLGGGERGARLWDVSLGQPPQPLDETSWYVEMPRGAWLREPHYQGLSPDGRRLLVAANGTVRVWDAVTGERLAGPAAYRGRVSRATLSRDGRLVVLDCWGERGKPDESAETVQVLDLATGRPLQAPLPLAGRRLDALDADHLRAAVVGPDPDAEGNTRVEVWDLAGGRALSPPRSIPGVVSADFSRDGRFLVTLADDHPHDEQGTPTEGTARVWGWDGAEPVGPPVPDIGLGTPGGIQLELSAGGDRLLVVAPPAREKARGPAVRVYEVGTGRLVVQLPVRDVRAASFSADARRVVAVGPDRAARGWDAATGQALTPPMRLPGEVVKAAFGGDGRLIVGSGTAGPVRLWDARTGEPLTPPLGSQVDEYGLDPGGRLVTLERKGPGNGTRTVRVYDVSPDPRPVGELRALAHALAGARVDETGGYVPLEWEDYRKAWQAVRPHGAPPPDGLMGERLAWHAAEADRQEWAKHWAAAVEHLTPLIEAQPHRWRLYARRGHARLELRQWQQAVADLTSAAERGAEDPSVWVDRGNARAELGQWKGAADDFARAAEIDAAEYGAPGDPHELLPLIALAYVGGGNQAGYQLARAAVVKEIDEEARKDGFVTEDAAWVAVLTPATGGEVAGVITLFEKQVAGPRKDAGELRILGAALTRAGKDPEAVKRLKEAVALREEFPSAWLFLAIAHARAGQADEARPWLDKARKWLDEPGRPETLSWDDRLRLKVLRDEAEGLLKAGK